MFLFVAPHRVTRRGAPLSTDFGTIHDARLFDFVGFGLPAFGFAEAGAFLFKPVFFFCFSSGCAPFAMAISFGFRM